MKPNPGALSRILTATEEGQGLVEYALIMFLVALVIIAVLVLIGPQLGSMYSSIVSAL